ncbi:hypothetical protein [Eisenibacter elegans]|uniref:hypothetical protein n=1 Tax=Eisenibacter elegans TaxID=997 RepID=UPI00041E8D86|nr:hypothetical protein [Eisenibacter elegans]
MVAEIVFHTGQLKALLSLLVLGAGLWLLYKAYLHVALRDVSEDRNIGQRPFFDAEGFREKYLRPSKPTDDEQLPRRD